MSNSPPSKRQKTIDIENFPRMSSETAELDSKALNKFSRQNAALGAETTAKLIKMKVIIYGLRSVGVETCKNLSLQGIGGLTLVDSEVITAKDLGQNFFFYETDTGKIRSEVVLPRLKELNPICNINAAPSLESLTLTSTSYHALVITQMMSLPELLTWNAKCRAANISFLYAFTGGCAVDLFVDHGPSHVVHDPTGEKPMQKLITNITPVVVEEDDGVCKELLIRYETPEGQQAVSIYKGHYEVSEVESNVNINHITYPITIGDKDPVKTLRIPYTGGAAGPFQYVNGGLLTEKKVPSPYPMQSLAEKLANPGDPWSDPPTMVQTDYFGFETQQHLAFYAVHEFYATYARLPSILSPADFQTVLALANQLIVKETAKVTVQEGFELDVTYLKKYVYFIGSELQCLGAFLGGVCAQEVVKITGKFTPIPGWFHFSSFEALPVFETTDGALLNNTGGDRAVRNHRYDDLASIYTWEMVQRLNNLQYFMVGCGALGCEFLKNFALNGICCSADGEGKGKLTVTDADRIELSNLSRQFLFREHNVGQAKSRAACSMAKQINPALQVEAMEVFVGQKSEDIFTDDFWTGLDGICNALDNIEARLYVDSMCLKYEKPLLESGTMGTDGNVDTIVPFKTRSYGEGGNAAEGGGVPMCTLRNFPHLTDHCIEWSRDLFELLFVKLGKTLEAYVTDPATFEAKIRDKASSEPGAAFFDIRSIISFAKLVANPTIRSAVQAAFDLFHYLFRDRILDLQNAFPKDFRLVDEKTKQDKGPFWGEKKRYPTVAVFTASNPEHVAFLQSTAILLAVSTGVFPAKVDGSTTAWLPEYHTSGWLVNMVDSLAIPAYLQAPVNSEGLENAPKLDADSLEEKLQSLFRSLAAVTQPFTTSSSVSMSSTAAATATTSTAVTAAQSTLVAAKFLYEPAAFEKDDDENFHIAFVTATANLRCDNYSIKHTDFHACKVIAGKIIAAIATTTAAVCGLVVLELLKVVMGYDTDAYFNRNLGLGANKYTSFSAEQPVAYKTRTEVTVPGPDEALPADAYDAQGKIKEEYCTKTVKRAYPEGHSNWDKLTLSGSLSLKAFSAWLDEKHGLKLTSWDFIYGYRTVIDEETKRKTSVGVSAKVYPPAPKLDYSLLPSLELTLGQASAQIMKTAAAKPTQQYLALWRECKAAGKLPDAAAAANGAAGAANNSVITEDTTLTEVLQKMVSLADEAYEKGLIESKAISHLQLRKFVVIPGKETPSVVDKESGEEVEHLCALKIEL